MTSSAAAAESKVYGAEPAIGCWALLVMWLMGVAQQACGRVLGLSRRR